MKEKTMKMIIYYVLSVYDNDKKNIESCKEITDLFMLMIKNEETKLDRLLNSFPIEHPVSKNYFEIKKLNAEEITNLLKYCKEKLNNYVEQNIDFNKMEDDDEVEELIKNIVK